MGAAIVRTAMLVALYAAIYAYTAWWVMLMLGIAHGGYEPIPALGYWTTVPLVLAVGSTVFTALIYKDATEALRP